MRRPKSVTALGFVLILIAVLVLLSAARGILVYFESAQFGGVATQMSLAEYLLERPVETLLPPLIGLMAGFAGVGVLRGQRWARPIAVGVGAATILGGAILLLGALARSTLSSSNA